MSDHHHHHEHDHTPANFGRAFLVGVILNLLFIIAEIIYGLKANSLSLLADAGHNMTDVLALLMAWGATMLARRKPSERFTYGLQSSSIIAALTNAVLLLVVVGGIGLEAFQRLLHPEPVVGRVIIIVAACGILVNGITALMFMAGRKGDLNIRAAFFHMLSDAVVSAGVVVSGLVILRTGWLWLDPAVCIVISLVIIFGTWGLLKDSVNLALHAVPKDIELNAVKSYLENLADVCEVHDLHIWAMSTTEVALTAHVLVSNGHPGDGFLKTLAHQLAHKYKISHTTIQIELGGEECALAPDNVV